MFTSEGRFNVRVKDAYLAEPKFNDQAPFDVCLIVATDDGQEGFWTGEVSDDYGKGNFSDLHQWEITLKTLEKLGWKHGQDFSKIADLKNVDTVATVKGREYEGNMYYDIKYLGDTFKPRKLNSEAIAERMKTFGKGPKAAKFQPEKEDQPENSITDENPFG